MKQLIIVILAAMLALTSVAFVVGENTAETTASVDVTVWQRVSDGNLYLSTRPDGGKWTTHNTPLDMSQLSSSGKFRKGSAITVAVPVSVVIPESPPVPTGTVTGVGSAVADLRIPAEGRYSCTATVSDNSTAYGTGDNFIAKFHHEGIWIGYTTLANEIYVAGSEIVLLPTLPKGDYLIEVNVAQGASWSVACIKRQ